MFYDFWPTGDSHGEHVSGISVFSTESGLPHLFLLYSQPASKPAANSQQPASQPASSQPASFSDHVFFIPIACGSGRSAYEALLYTCSVRVFLVSMVFGF